MNVNLTIDGVPVTVPKGTLLVEAAKTIKQEIPVYCYHTKLGPGGSVPHLLGRNRRHAEAADRVQHRRRPKAWSCSTHGERVEAGARRGSRAAARQPSARLSDLRQGRRVRSAGLLDGLRARHLRRGRIRRSRKPKAVDLGPTIVLDEERCVVCQRCVRFDDIIADERQLVVKDRGAHDIIATATGRPYRHNFTGNVTELCPGRRADLEDVIASSRVLGT